MNVLCFQIGDWAGFWEWANSTMLDALYDEQYPGFLSNQISYRLTLPRLRQLRVNQGQCQVYRHGGTLSLRTDTVFASEDRHVLSVWGSFL